MNKYRMMSIFPLVTMFSVLAVRHAGAFSSSTKICSPVSSLDMTNNIDDTTSTQHEHTRRSWLQTSSILIGTGMISSATTAFPQSALAREVTDASSGELPDLPPEAVRSYLQYRFSLQLAADFYIFDLQTMVGDTDEFGAVSELVASKGARGGQGGASRIEREYVNPSEYLLIRVRSLLVMICNWGEQQLNKLSTSNCCFVVGDSAYPWVEHAT